MSISLFVESSYKISKLITKQYSTSFSQATSLLNREQRRSVYAIYGFVRLADEIVDTFQNYDKAFLLNRLEQELAYALEHGISTNTLLMAFADTVHKYNLDREHIQAFINSMRIDLYKTDYSNPADLAGYIYGSADVVGLMCLKVFCNGDQDLYKRLEYPARKLGSAFQKVNFLRDLKNDQMNLGRNYFPELSESRFSQETKIQIEQSIAADFAEARKGIIQLPGRSKLAVLLAYRYYQALFEKLKCKSPAQMMAERIRISNRMKYRLLLRVMVLYLFRISTID